MIDRSQLTGIQDVIADLIDEDCILSRNTRKLGFRKAASWVLLRKILVEKPSGLMYLLQGPPQPSIIISAARYHRLKREKSIRADEFDPSEDH